MHRCTPRALIALIALIVVGLAVGASPAAASPAAKINAPNVTVKSDTWAKFSGTIDRAGEFKLGTHTLRSFACPNPDPDQNTDCSIKNDPNGPWPFNPGCTGHALVDAIAYGNTHSLPESLGPITYYTIAGFERRGFTWLSCDVVVERGSYGCRYRIETAGDNGVQTGWAAGNVRCYRTFASGTTWRYYPV